MGSDSDWPVMSAAGAGPAGVRHAVTRPMSSPLIGCPTRWSRYGRTAHTRGLEVIIAGAGGAAHLPGMLAAVTPLPVIGVPVR